MNAIEFTTDKREGLFGDWSRSAIVDGVEYIVSVKRGKSVRIAFKPRGQNRGWQWNGAVYRKGGGCIWDGRVSKSIGVRGLLVLAGVYPDKEIEQ